MQRSPHARPCRWQYTHVRSDQQIWKRQRRRLAFGIADAIEVVHIGPGFRDGILYDFESPLSMMYSCVAGEEPFTRRCDVGMPNV